MRSIVVYIVLATTLLMYGCRVRITPIAPPPDPYKPEANTCKAPAINKNIIGTWKGGIAFNRLRDTIKRSAPFTTATFLRIGTITFKADGTVVDPDALFETYLEDIGPVISKVYEIKTATDSYSSLQVYGELVWVLLYPKQTATAFGATKHYFKVITNECSRVHLKGPGTYELVLMKP